VPASFFQVVGAISLTRTTAAGTVETVVDLSNGMVITSAGGLVTSITITFANVNNAGVNFGSLADGLWQLSIPQADYQSPTGDTTLRRLFGDIHNDGTIEGGVDFSEFGARFGLSI